MATLLDQAQRLSVEERVHLVEAIWDSIAADAGLTELALPESHRLELDRRLDELEADPGAEGVWEEVRTRLARRS